MLEKIFKELVIKYNSNTTIADELWDEIVQHYSSKSRYYHTLKHLENIYNEITQCRKQVEDWDTILFSLFYHDIIYNATKKNNEEKSIDLAVKRLIQLNYHTHKIDLCYLTILATKTHDMSDNHDINLFTDADLSILGSSWLEYEQYCKQIRSEYSIYPDFLYNPGRKKALKHFSAMDSIFKTEFFRNKYESTARDNINKELNLL